MTYRIKLFVGALPTKDVAGKIQNRIQHSEVVEGVENVHFNFTAESVNVRSEVIEMLNSLGMSGWTRENIKILGEVQEPRALWATQ